MDSVYLQGNRGTKPVLKPKTFLRIKKKFELAESREDIREGGDHLVKGGGIEQEVIYIY